jgi:hypothetical protein
LAFCLKTTTTKNKNKIKSLQVGTVAWECAPRNVFSLGFASFNLFLSKNIYLDLDVGYPRHFIC